MMDLSAPIDTLPLFNCSQNIKLKHKESFPFIFNDNLDFPTHLFNARKMRPITFDNIQKTILCGSIYLGYDFYECPACHEETIVPHSCHSRFCTKCGAARNTLACLFNDSKFRKNKNKNKNDIFPHKRKKIKYAYKNNKDKDQ